MLELGNKRNSNGIYKKYFKSINVEHVSMDWNGQDGAIKADLRDSLDVFSPGNKWHQYFDIVTNIGTSEHVIPQGHIWENIINALAINGVLVCMTPQPGNWKWHQEGGRYPTLDFYHNFAENNGLQIELIKICNNFPRQLISTRMIKTRHPETIIFNKEMIYVNRI